MEKLTALQKAADAAKYKKLQELIEGFRLFTLEDVEEELIPEFCLLFPVLPAGPG